MFEITTAQLNGNVRSINRTAQREKGEREKIEMRSDLKRSNGELANPVFSYRGKSAVEMFRNETITMELLHAADAEAFV